MSKAQDFMLGFETGALGSSYWLDIKMKLVRKSNRAAFEEGYKLGRQVRREAAQYSREHYSKEVKNG